MEQVYKSELNRDVPLARPDEFAAVDIGSLSVWPPVVLAPMAGVTNWPFRAICRRFGAGLYVSEMVTAHSCYRQLGRTARARQKTYLGLFETMIGQKIIDEINMATNKEWALENKRFKQQIEKQAGRRVEPLGRGGDRKSKANRDGNETQRL